MRHTQTVTEVKCDLCGEFCADSRIVEGATPGDPIGPIPYRALQVESSGRWTARPVERAEVIACPRCMARPINDVLTFAGEGF